MKLRLLLSFLIGICFTSWGQDFYKTTWTNQGNTYEGLLIYYQESDAIMRISFDYQGKKCIAEYKCQGEYFDDANYSGYLLDGFSAQMIKGNMSLKYIPDNFIFVKSGQTYETPYVIDDGDLSAGNYTTLKKVDSWGKAESSQFSVSFIEQFFLPSEELYKQLLSLNSNNSLDGFRISSTAYGDGLWAVAMSKGTDLTKQTWKTSSSFPSSWIDKQWNKGLDITGIAYGQNMWQVTMSKGAGYIKQAWTTNTSLDNNWIKKKWNEGYAITEMVYANNQWATVMSKGTSYYHQAFEASQVYPSKWINQKWSEGYSITSVTFGQGHWIVVMSKGASLGLQSWKTSQNFPKKWVNNNWQRDYYITSIGYANGLWCVVMSEKTDFTTQTWKTSYDFPKTWIQDKLDEVATQQVITNNNNTNNNNHTTVTNNNTNTNNNNNNNTNTNTNTYSSSANVNLHLIVAANTKIFDIGTSCRVDQKRVESEFETICNELNIGFNKVVINEEQLQKVNIQQALNNLHPGKNDIVVFIYSGHGYRFSNEDSPYPRISLRYNTYQSVNTSTSFNLEEIYDQVVAKGARLNIVFGDCCNSNLGVTSRGGGSGILASRNQIQGKISRLKKLFIDTRGNILAAAAQPNQTACGNARDGGYFLMSFFQSLNKETSYLSASEKPSWDNILTNTMKAASYKTQSLNGCKQQNGIYDFHIPAR